MPSQAPNKLANERESASLSTIDHDTVRPLCTRYPWLTKPATTNRTAATPAAVRL